MTRASELAPSSLPRQQRRRIDRQLYRLALGREPVPHDQQALDASIQTYTMDHRD
jgi:hypothetical protein